MQNVKKVHVKVKEFPEHNLPLLLTLPPGMQYINSHDNAFNCNLLVVQNNQGATRVYSMGRDVLNEDDLRGIFSWSN